MDSKTKEVQRDDHLKSPTFQTLSILWSLSVLSPAAPPRQPTLLNGELWGQREKQVVMVGALISWEGIRGLVQVGLYILKQKVIHTHTKNSMICKIVKKAS